MRPINTIDYQPVNNQPANGMNNQPANDMNNQPANNTSGKTIVVGLVGARKPYMFKNSGGMIDGLDYEIWKAIENEQKFKCEYKYIDNPNYDEEIDNLANGKYDVLVGNISVTHPRSFKILYTSLIYLDLNILVYKRTATEVYGKYLGLFIGRGIKPFLILTLMGIILGWLLKKNTKKGSFLFSFYNTMISLLGEFQHLRKNTKSKYFEFGVSFLIIFVSFYFTLLLQGITTTDLIKLETSHDPFTEVSDLANKNIITVKGTAQSDFLKFYKNKVDLNVTDIDYQELPEDIKANIDEDNVIEAIAQYYLKNSRKYDGFYISEELFREIKDKFPELYISDINLGYDEIAIAVNKKHHDLVRAINISIASMKDKRLLSSICDKYLKGDNTKCLL